MKKKNIKPLVLSSLAALSLGSMSVAGTFALFTDQAETTISIGAAEVSVKNAMTIVDAYSLNQLDANTHTTKEAHYVNGGEVEVTDNTAGETTQIDVVNWTPGDGVKLRTAPTNSSNVTIKVRLKAVMSGLLAPALVMEVRNAEATGDATYAAKGSRTLVSDWVEVDPGENPAAFDLDIKFPNHGFEITAREEGIDNQYQGKPATIMISYEAVQGNADVSSSLLEKINTRLATNEVNDGKNVNMYEAVNDLAVANVATLAQIKANNYVWGADEDLFYEAAGVTSGQEYKYFKTVSNQDAAGDFSIYAYDDWSAASVSLTGIGFDAGNAEGITSVSYTGIALTPRKNIIRTNSSATSVNVDASLDTISHYGNAGSLVINAIAGNSYHENGKVAFAEIKTGRLALEKGAEVEQIHLNVTGEGEQAHFNDIVIAKDEAVDMPVFSRDPVTIPEGGRLVVALQEGTEQITEQTELDYVWLTAVGVYEQVAVSDNKESTISTNETQPTFAASDASVNTEKKGAAQQIANNISVEIGEDKYEVKAELNNQGEWEYKLEGESEAKTEAVADYEVTVTETVQEQTQSVVQEVVVKHESETVESTAKIENGLTGDEKAAVIEVKVEEAIQHECQHEHVSRAHNDYWKRVDDKYEFHSDYVCDDCGKKLDIKHDLAGMWSNTEHHPVPFVADNLNAVGLMGQEFVNSFLSQYNDSYIGDIPFNALNYFAVFNSGRALEMANYQDSYALYDSGNKIDLNNLPENYNPDFNNITAVATSSEDDARISSAMMQDIFQDDVVDFYMTFDRDIPASIVRLCGAYSGMTMSIDPTQFGVTQFVAGKKQPIMLQAGWGLPFSFLLNNDVTFLCGLYINAAVAVQQYGQSEEGMAYLMDVLENGHVTLGLSIYSHLANYFELQGEMFTTFELTVPIKTVVGDLGL